MINRTFSRPQKCVLQRHPAAAADVGYFDFAIQGQQANGAVTGRQSVGHVARQRAHVTHLWSADHAATFRQAGPMLNDAFIFDNPAVGYHASDHDMAIIKNNAIEAGNSGRVYHGFHRRAQALLNFQQQVGAPANYLRAAVVVIQKLDRCFN